MLHSIEKLHSAADGLSPTFIHMRILLSMVVGLGLTHLLRHLARIIEHPTRKRIYWVHLVWVGSIFLYLVSFWWWEYHLTLIARWNFNVYLFVTVYALLLYLLCTLVLPENIDEFQDWRDHFYARRRWFFGLLALVCFADVFDTRIKGAAYFTRLGHETLLQDSVFIALSAIAIATDNRRFHAAFALTMLAYQLYFMFRLYYVL